MDNNRLKMNTDKTEFVMIGGRQQLSKATTSDINVNGDIIQLSETAT